MKEQRNKRDIRHVGTKQQMVGINPIFSVITLNKAEISSMSKKPTEANRIHLTGEIPKIQRHEEC